MNYDKMAKNLEGLQTVSSAAKTLGVGRRTAVNYISKLKKYGYVRTSRGKGKIRLYEISRRIFRRGVFCLSPCWSLRNHIFSVLKYNLQLSVGLRRVFWLRLKLFAALLSFLPSCRNSFYITFFKSII